MPPDFFCLKPHQFVAFSLLAFWSPEHRQWKVSEAELLNTHPLSD
jgi:hypothetical protein